MKKRSLKIVLWVVSIVIFIVLTGIVINKYGRNKCKNVEITIDAPADGAFLTEEDVMSYAVESGSPLANKDLSKINVEKLESIISSKPFVQKSRVYLSINGTLHIDVTQRTPIARVQPDTRLAGIAGINSSSYYISSDGRLMPLAKGKTARVIFVNGNIRNLYNEMIKLDVDSTFIAQDSVGFFTTLYSIFHIAKYINEDDFLKAQIQQIFVDEKSDMILIPEVGNHIVIFGRGDNIDKKFRRLKLFYEKAPFIEGWDKYDTINIKFKDQIICS